MKTFIITATAALTMALSSVSAHAGGWGSSNWNGYNSHQQSSGLINVAPSVRTGDLNLLNGLGVLNNSPIASGNVVSGILSGNKTGNGILGNGVLNGSTLGILGGNGQRYSVKGRR
jgi:hypothetical protein